MVQTLPAQSALPFPVADRMRRVKSSAIRELLTITERPEIISLAGGLPAPESFPTREIADAVAAVLAADPAAALQYSATEGYRPLRSLIADEYGAGLDQVIITSGSQQALELVARATVDPGTEVALADPGYVGAIQALKLAGAKLLAVPSDADGMRVDRLEATLRAGGRPALVYVVANFDNPTGATLGLDRRRALAGLASRYGFVIVEDDPYGELRWDGEPVAPLRTLSDRVISIGTVSKTLCPGLRIGYAVCPVALAQPLALLKQAVDLHTSTLSQMVVHRVLSSHGFRRSHLAEIRRLYEHRASSLTSAITEQLPGVLEFARPQGGMFIWARLLRSGIDTHELLPAALAHGVAYVPGRAFGIAHRHPEMLRLSFATASPDALSEGVGRLRTALGCA